MCCPDELAIAVAAVAAAISKELSAESTELLSAVFVQLGDTLATISAAKSFCESRESCS